MLAAGPVLLEPIYNVEVTVPADNMGDVMGRLQFPGVLVFMEWIKRLQSNGQKALLAEMQRYLMICVP